MRILLFVVAFVVGVVLLAPLERWLLPALRAPLASANVELRVDSLRLALPAGIRATGVVVQTDGAGLDIDSLYVGITGAFEADACGGRVGGRIGRESVSIDLSGVDPSRCLRVGKLSVESRLDGSLSLDGIDLLRPGTGASTSARISVTSAGGVFRGILPHAGTGGADLPLGEWEFTDLVVRATLAGGELDVEEGHALTSGVEWQLLGARVPAAEGKSGWRIDVRARQVDDAPRSRALIGLMPKATRDALGWRNYRITGSLAAPRVIGIE